MYQPVGRAVFVVLPAVFESVLKVSVGIAESSVVSETLLVPVSASAVGRMRATSTNARLAAKRINDTTTTILLRALVVTRGAREVFFTDMAFLIFRFRDVAFRLGETSGLNSTDGKLRQVQVWKEFFTSACSARQAINSLEPLILS